MTTHLSFSVLWKKASSSTRQHRLGARSLVSWRPMWIKEGEERCRISLTRSRTPCQNLTHLLLIATLGLFSCFDHCKSRKSTFCRLLHVTEATLRKRMLHKYGCLFFRMKLTRPQYRPLLLLVTKQPLCNTLQHHRQQQWSPHLRKPEKPHSFFTLDQ